MTNKQILQKVIEKAIKNGFDGEGYELGLPFNIIYRHDFAKAFWGEKGEEVSIPASIRNPALVNRWEHNYWKEHLKRMVLEKEPLKYLEKFL